MSDLSLRDAGPADAARIYAITRSAFLEYASDVPPPSALFETEEEVAAELAGGVQAIVAVLCADGERPAGCVRFRVERDGLHFFRLAVAPSARRKGVARALLRHLEQIARQSGCRRIWCHARVQVARNVALYHREGFRPAGEDLQFRAGFTIQVTIMEKTLEEGKGCEYGNDD